MMFKVCAERCYQCLFSKDRIVSEKRMREVLSDCAKRDSHFICHKTDDACCKGFYDTRTTNLMRIAQRLGAVEFVNIDQGEAHEHATEAARAASALAVPDATEANAEQRPNPPLVRLADV
jgi:hypothetical protein